MNSTERRMKLILMLQQSTKRLTVDDIADKFNTSRRTVFRDFNALSELNVPVTYDKYTGYGILQGYSIPPLMFTTKELSIILIGLNFVKSQIDQTMVEDAEGVELKIREVLPDELKEYMKSLNERTVVDPYLHYGPGKVEGGNWYQIINAISENQSIEFSYQNKLRETEFNQRKIDPYLLVFYGDHWNTIGFSHKREAIRNFVLDRMTGIHLSEDNFVPYGSIDAHSLIYRTSESSHTIEVAVHESVLQRFEANIPAKIDSKSQEKGSVFNVKFNFDNLNFINEWLLQFPKTVTIVSPDVLIKKRHQLLREMIDTLN